MAAVMDTPTFLDDVIGKAFGAIGRANVDWTRDADASEVMPAIRKKPESSG